MRDSPAGIDLVLGRRLNNRLQRYARELGVTPESVLVESVVAYMDTYPLRKRRASASRRRRNDR